MTEMSVALLILPGINGSGVEHWQSHWERALPNARRVPEDDWDNPVCALWTAALERAVAQAGSNTLLVAHSLGCLQVAHWAARTRLAVRGALLVAPPDPDEPTFPSCVEGWRPLPRQRLPFPSLLVASRDDPYSKFEFSQRVASTWESQLIDPGRCGHINASSGLGAWPAGQAFLEQLARTAPPPR